MNKEYNALIRNHTWIANPSRKSSPIDRRTSRRREEDDPPGDQSPPPESILDVMKSLLLLRGLEDEAP
ncbi:unnamed protein product [Spirodela intermedia]|uniref:Uncharacterized protein n=1 Tax=Spirodela intermedia TaxID=51605 RepID=A0A7I8KPW0_SPIIN|nr:unnamed protein product [Spirodela intermedia]